MKLNLIGSPMVDKVNYLADSQHWHDIFESKNQKMKKRERKKLSSSHKFRVEDKASK